MCALVIVPVHFSDDLGWPPSVEVVEVQLLDLAIIGLDDRVPDRPTGRLKSIRT